MNANLALTPTNPNTAMPQQQLQSLPKSKVMRLELCRIMEEQLLHHQDIETVYGPLHEQLASCILLSRTQLKQELRDIEEASCGDIFDFDENGDLEETVLLQRRSRGKWGHELRADGITRVSRDGPRSLDEGMEEQDISVEAPPLGGASSLVFQGNEDDELDEGSDEEDDDEGEAAVHVDGEAVALEVQGEGPTGNATAAASVEEVESAEAQGSQQASDDPKAKKAKKGKKGKKAKKEEVVEDAGPAEDSDADEMGSDTAALRQAYPPTPPLAHIYACMGIVGLASHTDTPPPPGHRGSRSSYGRRGSLLLSDVMCLALLPQGPQAAAAAALPAAPGGPRPRRCTRRLRSHGQPRGVPA